MGIMTAGPALAELINAPVIAENQPAQVADKFVWEILVYTCVHTST
ncbi:MAG TPA: hypothetical protein PLM14_11010 [Candidatus Hydrogenedentes bacterium]|nr:hypothetical protein [Candidatus Hydrogenedentota bacterium]